MNATTSEAKPPSFAWHFLKWFGLLIVVALGVNVYLHHYFDATHGKSPDQAFKEAVASEYGQRASSTVKPKVPETRPVGAVPEDSGVASADQGVPGDKGAAGQSVPPAPPEPGKAANNAGAKPEGTPQPVVATVTSPVPERLAAPVEGSPAAIAHQAGPQSAQGASYPALNNSRSCSEVFPTSSTAAGDQAWYRGGRQYSILDIAGGRFNAVAQLWQAGQLRLQLAVPKGAAMRIQIPAGHYQVRVSAGTMWCGFESGFKDGRPLFDEDVTATQNSPVTLAVPSM